jgi:hypothetical protein
MGVVLAYDSLDGDVEEVTKRAKQLASKIKIVP